MKFGLILAAAVALFAIGCVSELRGSSRVALSSQQSSVTLDESMADVARRLDALFAKRSFTLTDRRPDGEGFVYTYKGNRTSVTVVTGNHYGVYGASDTLGSAFDVRLSPRAQATLVELIGRPSVDGRVACSDDAEAWVGRCDSVVMGVLWPGRTQATGREEAEVIRGILVELDMTGKVVAPPAAPPEPPRPRCRASELPEWASASPEEKKALLDRCRGVPAPGGATGASP